MKVKKTHQQENDERALRGHGAVGSDNPGGQDAIDPQRLVPGLSNRPKFRGISHKGD